jgi:hypothetical protein
MIKSLATFILLIISFSLFSITPYITKGHCEGELYLSMAWYDSGLDGFSAIFKVRNYGDDINLQIHSQSPEWPLEDHIAYPQIVSDATPDFLYAFLNSKLWSSDNGAQSWNLLSETDGNFFSGVEEGEIYKQRNGIHRSLDYGNSFDFLSWSNGLIIKDIGTESGEFYAISDDVYPDPHILKYSSDFGETFNQQCIIEDQIPDTQSYYSIHRGNLSGELYLLAKDSPEHYYIYRSTDYGQTYTFMHQTEIFESFYGRPVFISGNVPGECYYVVARFDWYNMILRIFSSTDYGQTFTEHYHYLTKGSFPADTYQTMFIPYNDMNSHYFQTPDVLLQFTEEHLEFEMTIHSYCQTPSIVGELPAGIENIAGRYWSVTSFPENPGSSYNISFDLTNFVDGIENFETLHFLTREDEQSEWQDVTDLGATLIYNDLGENWITIQGLDSFSDFVPAGGSDNPLPVQLSSFTAIQTSANFAQINWTTQSENNLLGFNIYRNTRNTISEATKLNNTIIEAFNSSSEQNYLYTDDLVELGETYYYWLKSVSMDGSSTICGTITITIENEDSPELPTLTKLKSAYPNPFNPETKIEFSVKENDIAELTIYNAKGQIVKTYSVFFAGNHIVNWQGKDNQGNNVSSGLFFYELKSQTNKEIKKMILLK